MEMNMVSIYVLPTEVGMPPRALLFEGEMPTGDEARGMVTTWSADLGTWVMDSMPVPEPLAEAITQHAKNLGVESFLR